jgi:hypothetical protein
MRFFNLDLHIAVIADLKQIFTGMGHEVTDWSISAHAWVFGRARDKVDVVNEKTWMSIDKAMCDAFYDRYKDELDCYDAFVVTHTPCFAMLYERWNKPVICVASTRYEHPFTARPAEWEYFNQFLRRQIDAGIVIPVANNKYDADYAEVFTGRKWTVIPSLCDYTGAKYSGRLSSSLLSTKFTDMPAMRSLVDKRKVSRSLRSKVLSKLGIASKSRGYSWQDIADFQSVVHLPYNASVMSIFEMYAAGVPMFFPSVAFAAELYARYRDQGVFSELSFNQVYGLPSGSTIPAAKPDPNNFSDVADMSNWIAKSDFYDNANLDGLAYFDSFDHLAKLLQTADLDAMHRTMVSQHELRTENVYSAWRNILTDLGNR